MITTFTFPVASSPLTQPGRSNAIWSYRAAAIRRDIVTTIALPANTSRRASQCCTISAANSARRCSEPTTASTRAHRDFIRSAACSSVPETASANSSSNSANASAVSRTRASRGS